jgi:hypothetical protein
MRRPPGLLILTFIIGLILAACGSPAGSPGASSGGEPSTAASEAPAGSDGSSGGGGGTGGGSGSAQFEITGGYQASGDYPFVGGLGYWQQAGVSFMVFTPDEEASEATGLIITLSDDGSVLQYVAEDITIPAATCEWNITKNDASGAAGSFTCNDQAGFGTSGALTDLDISGSFEATP